MIVKIRFFANGPIEQNKWRGGSAPLPILQIGGISAKNESNQCAFALFLPELHITLASRLLAAFTQLARHCFGHCHRAFYRRGRVSIETRLFGDAKSGLGENTDNGN
jgi:hypothetical protein